MANASDAAFHPLHIAATRAGVSAAWLRAEAEAGRVPHLRVGRRFLFDVDAVLCSLRERAQAAASNAAQSDVSVGPHELPPVVKQSKRLTGECHVD